MEKPNQKLKSYSQGLSFIGKSSQCWVGMESEMESEFNKQFNAKTSWGHCAEVRLY